MTLRTCIGGPGPDGRQEGCSEPGTFWTPYRHTFPQHPVCNRHAIAWHGRIPEPDANPYTEYRPIQ